MKTKVLKIKPNTCPACRSVQVKVVNIIDDKERICQCGSCQKTFRQTFYPGANMSVESPVACFDLDGRTLWSNTPKRN